MAKSNIFHIIISPSGQYFWWTLAPTEDGAWDALRQSYPNLSRARRQGCRCVEVELTRVKERKGKEQNEKNTINHDG